ncbi:hypothetical protein EDC04DRAFT_2677242, partial [Pisolithus marmoratus]
MAATNPFLGVLYFCLCGHWTVVLPELSVEEVRPKFAARERRLSHGSYQIFRLTTGRFCLFEKPCCEWLVPRKPLSPTSSSNRRLIMR